MSKNNAWVQEQKQHAARLLQSNCAADARKVLLNASSKSHKDVDIWNMLGAANSMLGLYPEAEKCIRRVISLLPQNAQAHNNLGSALRAQGKFKEAVSQFDKAIRINPAYAMAHFNRGGVLQECGAIDEAIKSFQRASQLAPQDADIRYSLAEAFRASRDLDSALKHYRQALQMKPGLVDAVTRIADIYKTRNQCAEAFKVLEPYVQSRPNEVSINVALSYALLCRHTGRYEDGIELLERVKLGASDTLLNKDRAAVSFVLGNLYDARGDYEAAFSSYMAGNKLKLGGREADKYSAEEGMRLRATMEVFTPQFFERTPRASNGSETPVFIVGMPRSGTSLVEQILCSHPAIFGAGELTLLNEAGDELQKMIGAALPYPSCLQLVKQEHADRVANHCLVKLRKLSTDNALRITDKMPGNYWNLGLIYLLFPKARVIHCVRNPLDTCLSIYFQDFANAHLYTNDLKSIGRGYNIYRQVMEYWRRVLKYPILDVHYEELVANQEGVSRRLVEYCGLPWDEHCLHFQDNPRMVMTASHDQVRRAIYKTSTDRWKNYQAFIGPLIEGLGNVRGDPGDSIAPRKWGKSD